MCVRAQYRTAPGVWLWYGVVWFCVLLVCCVSHSLQSSDLTSPVAGAHHREPLAAHPRGGARCDPVVPVLALLIFYNSLSYCENLAVCAVLCAVCAVCCVCSALCARVLCAVLCGSVLGCVCFAVLCGCIDVARGVLKVWPCTQNGSASKSGVWIV